MVSMKVYDDSVWSDYVKTGKVKGFSIEGHFADAMERPKEQLPEYGDEELEALSLIEELTEAMEVELRTYDDYPKAARENAQKVLNWRLRYGRDEVKGMTRVGWRRANQLAKGQKISRSTIARMASFNRHRRNATIDPDLRGTPWKDKGYVAWLGWGGTEGVDWAIRKMKQFRRGLGAFNTSHSPNVESASQWAHARVNAYMYPVKNGRPENAKYTTDYDLLPKKHPKSSK